MSEETPPAVPIVEPTAPGSWWSVILVLLALGGTIGAITGLWWPVAPQPPAGLDRYNPLGSGIALTYRVTGKDGQALRYHSSNSEQLPGADVAMMLDVNAFSSLMSLLQVDIANFDVDKAVAAVSSRPYARMVETDFSQAGPFTTTTTIYLPWPEGVSILQLRGVGFEPPVPMLTKTYRTVDLYKGTANGSIPYTDTVAVEAIESVDTPIGKFDDCLRVRHRFQIPGYDGFDRTWYCSGIGVAKMELGITGSPANESYALIAAATPDFASTAEVAPHADGPSAQLVRAFPQAGGDRLALSWYYQEQRSSAGITTPVLPAGDLLLYGTQNGGLVALDREKQEIRWRFQTGGAIYGAPTVSDGIVYLASTDRRLYALDLKSGGFLWAFATRDTIASAPTVADGLVYIGAEDRNIYAVDAQNGKERWRFQTAGPVASTPTVADGILYAGSDDGVLYALDSQSGQLLWAYVTGDAITASPTVLDGVVYVGSQDQSLYALRARTEEPGGELIWQYNTQEEVTTDVTAAGGVVYLALKQDLLALDATTGQEVWRYFGDKDLRGAPLLLGSQLLVRRDQEVLALDAQTGAELSIIPTTESASFAGLSSDGQEILVGHFDGILIVLKLERSGP